MVLLYSLAISPLQTFVPSVRLYAQPKKPSALPPPLLGIEKSYLPSFPKDSFSLVLPLPRWLPRAKQRLGLGPDRETVEKGTARKEEEEEGKMERLLIAAPFRRPHASLPHITAINPVF